MNDQASSLASPPVETPVMDSAPPAASPAPAQGSTDFGAVSASPDAVAPVHTVAADGDWGAFLNPVHDRIVDLLGNGGPVIVILAILSVIATAIILLKAWQFARLRPGAREPVEQALRLWCHDAPEEALQVLGNNRQPTARILRLAITGAGNPAIDHDTLREELARVAAAQLEKLRSYLRALEIIATLSPLLGLLGTVLGMIEAFRQLELAGSQVDPSILSGGIWQALLTTAAGLSVAIPVMMAHAWLERQVEQCGHRMEDAVTRVFTRGLRDMAHDRTTLRDGKDNRMDPALGHAA